MEQVVKQTVAQKKERLAYNASVLGEPTNSARYAYIGECRDEEADVSYFETIFTALGLSAHETLPFARQVQVTNSYKEVMMSVCYSYYREHRHLFVDRNSPESEILQKQYEDKQEAYIGAMVQTLDTAFASTEALAFAKNKYLGHERKEFSLDGKYDEYVEGVRILAQRAAETKHFQGALINMIAHTVANFIFYKNFSSSSVAIDWSPAEFIEIAKEIPLETLISIWKVSEEHLIENDLRAGGTLICDALIPAYARCLLEHLEHKEFHSCQAVAKLSPELRVAIKEEAITSSDWHALIEIFSEEFPPSDQSEGHVDMRDLGKAQVFGFEFSNVMTNADVAQQLIDWPFGVKPESPVVVFIDGVKVLGSTLPLNENHLNFNEPSIRSKILAANGSFVPLKTKDLSGRITICRTLFESKRPTDIRSEYAETLEHEKVHQAVTIISRRDKNFWNEAYHMILRDRRSIFEVINQTKYALDGINTKSFIHEELALLWTLMGEPEMQAKIKRDFPAHYKYAVEVMKAKVYP